VTTDTTAAGTASGLHELRSGDLAHSPGRAVAAAAYGSLFVVALPALLALWMRRLDHVLALPAPPAHPLVGWTIAAAGLLLMAWGMFGLWRRGGGLPMSPFPPARLVTEGAYRLVAHPIYVGAVVACAGFSVALGSAAGIWIGTPVLALAVTAFVLGYERDATLRRFGRSPRPWLHLPAYPAGRARLDAVVLTVCAVFLAVGLLARTRAVRGLGAGLAVVWLLYCGRALWRASCRVAEAIANSWREWRAGPVRFLNHGIYAALGAAVVFAVACRLAGPSATWWVLATILAGEVTAGLWAQVLEGSPQLLRPYGYFGSIVGVLGTAGVAAVAGDDSWRLLAAIATGGCFAQAFGRCRCLIQGCCHGRPIEAGWGIVYRHPRSRVIRLAHLGGVRLHPTPLYSILWTVTTGAVLLGLWGAGAPHSFIAGAYLVLIGLGRFVEEHYRGEPQTAWVRGLPIYQWLAIGFVVAGCAFTALGGNQAVVPAGADAAVLPLAVLVAAITYVAFGVDFPRSNRRFSRLAPAD
jgi:protein-S-isoprenylcysteine O-methyltransferase Ste14